ncbi:MAG: hypothetical protein COY40_04710, partial [Alphaproteobacteria bacterium CG_4_10_14_0_8_um_filter_53_9]
MIRLVVTGKLKERYLAEGEAEYMKRLRGWWAMDVLELAGSKLADPVAAAREEAIAQLRALDGWQGAVVVLSEDGRWAPDSVAFSGTLTAWRDAGRDVMILVGGASGFMPEVKARADKLMTLSALTFPHQMVRFFMA